MTAPPAPTARLSRRRLLTAGAAVAAAAALGVRLGGPDVVGTRREGPLARLAGDLGTRLSVGFLDLPDATTPLAAGMQVVPARTIASGGLVDTTISVRVDGATAGLADDLGDLTLDALFESPDPDDDLPLTFYAWTRRAGGSATSSPAPFTVGVEQRPSLGFTLAVAERAGAQPRAARAVFATVRDGRAPVLRQGRYLLGLDPAAWDRPRMLPADDDPAWEGLASLIVAVAPG